MDSIWEDGAERPQFDRLEKDIQTDVLVIGGGIAGILCAYQCKQAGLDCVLVEATRICGGVTKNTTAKITVQHGLIYDKLTREFGPAAAGRYLRANQAALEQYRTLCKTIDCDFRERDSYVYALGDRRKLEREQAALARIGGRAEWESSLPLPFPVAGALRMKGQAEFHPLRFLYSLARELQIYEHTPVQELRPHQAKTPHGAITANRIIVATHFPFLNKHGSYFLKLYQHRSYVLALQNEPRFQGMYVDEDKRGFPFARTGTCCCWAAARTAQAKREAAGGNWRPSSEATIPRPGSSANGPHKTV